MASLGANSEICKQATRERVPEPYAGSRKERTGSLSLKNGRGPKALVTPGPPKCGETN